MIDRLNDINNLIISECVDNEKKEKHLLIKKILADKDCFFKMNMETSYAILRELNFDEENVKRIYSELIDK